MLERAIKPTFPVSETTHDLARKIVVEVGPGELPIYRLSSTVLGRNDMYMGIDSDRVAFQRQRKRFGGEILGDLDSLPVRTESADEIWLMNVFGEFYSSTPFFYFAIRQVLPASMVNFLKEMKRVLRPGGRIYVGEYYTPPPFILDFDFSPLGLDQQIFTGQKIKEFLKEHGLETIGEIWKESFVESNVYKPFFLVLTKNLQSSG